MSKVLAPKSGSALCYVRGFYHPALGRAAPRSQTGADVEERRKRRKKKGVHPLGVGCVVLLFLVFGLMVWIAANWVGASEEANRLAKAEEEAEQAPQDRVQATDDAKAPENAEAFVRRTDICRAAIAKMMDQDISIMKVSSTRGPVVSVFYNRPSDSKLWKVDCELSGNDIGWRYVDATPGSGVGDWKMVGEFGETYSFKLHGDKVTITQDFSGSADVETYNIGKRA